jgi:hypothetical protein
MKMSQSICLFFFFLFSYSFYSSILSYWIWKWVNVFAGSFFSYSAIPFTIFTFICNMKTCQSICWFFFFLFSYSFCLPILSYVIWKRVNLFAGSFFSYSAIPFTHRYFHIIYENGWMYLLVLFFLIQLFLLPYSLLYRICKWVNVFAGSFFSYSALSFTIVTFICNMKMSQSVCWFFFFLFSYSFYSSILSYYIWKWVNVFAYSFSLIQLFLLLVHTFI